MECIVKLVNFIGNHAAEIIALCALLFTGYSTYATRRHDRLSVKPHLTTFVHRSQKPGEGFLAISLLNNGLGPALIDSYEILIDGSPLKIKNSNEAEKPLREVLGSLNFNHSVTVLGKQYSMPANERKDILILQFEAKTNTDFESVEEKLNRFDLVVKYRSMYGKSFEYDSRENDR